jgi:hypothetical protein
MKIMRGAVTAKVKPSYRGETCEEMKGQSDYLNRGGAKIKTKGGNHGSWFKRQGSTGNRCW